MTAALIIAAGKTNTMDHFEPMKPVGALSAVQRLIRVYKQAGVERIVLVVEPDDREVDKHVARLGVVCLTSDNGEMFDGVRTGLEYLKGKCTKVQITPVDIPLFTVETVKHLDALDGAVAMPLYDHRTGHPIQISEDKFEDILAYEGTGGLAGAVAALALPRLFVEVPDRGVLTDVAKSDDYADLIEQHSLSRLYPEVRLFMEREDNSYGPGAHQLMRLVEDTQSLRHACQQMGISYGKGWKMVNNIERLFGGDVFVRQPGGRHGGGTVITPKGQQMMARYDAWVRASREQVEKLFEEYFGE